MARPGWEWLEQLRQEEADRALKSSHNYTKSPLLSLPAELRNQIYDLLLPDMIFCRGAEREGGMCMRWHPREIPMLMRVCRHSRSELYAILFGDKGRIICLHDSKHYHGFVPFDSTNWRQ
ncbi:hypothetical protein LTR85_003556 [Meristemomyces frigidus]|nr:hypothetical protein LTR85_003556 [Meristemomyces frigidus]